jgi:hypothetical protein
MAWTKTTRKQYRRDGLRYASDTTDKEGKLLRPLLPKRSRTGRPSVDIDADPVHFFLGAPSRSTSRKGAIITG